MPRLRSALLLLFLAAPACAGDWPQWLGPTRDNRSPEVVAPWKGDLKVLWRRPVGEGHSSPVVAGGKVFLHTKVKDQDAEEVAAYDARTGMPLWAKTYARAPFKPPFGLGPRGTPSVHDGKVYTFGLTGVLTCSAADDGKQLWQVDTLKQFEAPNLFFGTSTSPLVEGDNVLVMVGGKGASVVAFKKGSGDVAWKAGDDKASYASPIAFGAGKGRQVVFLTQAGLRALSPADGASLWQFPFVDRLNEASTTPVRLNDELLMASAVTVGSVGLKLGMKEGKPGVEEAWKSAALTSYFSTPAPVGDYVYMVTGGVLPPPQADLHCVEIKTGKKMWSRPKVGKYHAAFLITGDNKLLMLDDGGHLTLIDPDPKEYKPLARADKLCGPTWAHPALSDGRLYLRDEKELICVQLGK